MTAMLKHLKSHRMLSAMLKQLKCNALAGGNKKDDAHADVVFRSIYFHVLYVYRMRLLDCFSGTKSAGDIAEQLRML